MFRTIPEPSIELMKTLIRAHAIKKLKEDPEIPWVVDEPFMSIHNVSTVSEYFCNCIKSSLHIENLTTIIKHYLMCICKTGLMSV